MKYGEPNYVSVDIEKVAELSENTNKRMLQNISGKILAEMAASSYPTLLESIYRSKSVGEMEKMLQHIGRLQELVGLLGG